MPRRVYYGSYGTKRKTDKKKKFFITLAVLAAIGIIVWVTLFFGTISRRDLGAMMKGSVNEITQLKLQLEEKDDEIAALNRKIEQYEAELAVRPTLAPTPVPPPNEAVLAGQATAAPTQAPTATKRPKASKTTPPPTVQPTQAVQPPTQQPQQPTQQPQSAENEQSVPSQSAPDTAQSQPQTQPDGAVG